MCWHRRLVRLLSRDARCQPSYYDTMQVCLNGHQITANYDARPEVRREFCDACGAPTIHQCPHCGALIRGAHITPGVAVLGGRIPVPKHCHKCGKPYPWTEAKKGGDEQAQALLERRSAIEMLERILQRFHRVAKQLECRRKDRDILKVIDEYDVQDLLHALLVLDFEDVRTEEWTPSYAGAGSRMDFLLKDEKIVVEVKCSRPSMTDRTLGDELLLDIARYKEHSDCQLLYCFVYDPHERIQNPRALERDLSRTPKDGDALAVRLLVTPQR